jgi:peptide/nickel transport system substrate-binding protein
MAFMFSILGAACGGQTSTGPSGFTYTAGGTAVVRTMGDFVNTFDPFKVPAISTRAFLDLTYDTLTAQGPNGKVLPYLATSWTVTPTSITFKLRNDATCADGTPVTPTVVKNSFQRAIDMPIQYARNNWGPGPYSVAADDAAGTFTFTVGTPYSDLIYGFGLGFNETDIICPAGLKNPAALATQTFGSGPYQIVSATHGDQVVIKLRKDWKWGPGGVIASTLGLPDTLIFKQVANETTAANLLLTGGLNVAWITGTDVDRLLADKTLHHADVPSPAAYVLAFNPTPGKATADPVVREALVTAVDPAGWLQGADNGHGSIAKSYWQPGTVCYQDQSSLLPKYSLTKAQQVLEADGYTLSGGKMVKNGQPLVVHFVDTTQHGAGPDYIVSQWQKLGVTVNATITDYATYSATAQVSGYDAITGVPSYNAVPPPGGAANRLSGPAPPKGINYGNIQDPLLDQEKAAAWASANPTEACMHWNNFWGEILKQHYVFPMTYDMQYYFTKDFVFATGGVAPLAAEDGLLALRRIKS